LTGSPPLGTSLRDTLPGEGPAALMLPFVAQNHPHGTFAHF